MKSPEYYAEKYKLSYMDMAYTVSKRSVAKRRKVGCIIYLSDHTLVEGWNGAESGCDNEVCEDENGITLPSIIHAEENALKKLLHSPNIRDILKSRGSIVFVTTEPCENCAGMLIGWGVSKVYYREEKRTSHKGLEDLVSAGVEVFKI